MIFELYIVLAVFFLLLTFSCLPLSLPQWDDNLFVWIVQSISISIYQVHLLWFSFFSFCFLRLYILFIILLKNHFHFVVAILLSYVSRIGRCMECKHNKILTKEKQINKNSWTLFFLLHPVFFFFSFDNKFYFHNFFVGFVLFTCLCIYFVTFFSFCLENK